MVLEPIALYAATRLAMAGPTSPVWRPVTSWASQVARACALVGLALAPGGRVIVSLFLVRPHLGWWVVQSGAEVQAHLIAHRPEQDKYRRQLETRRPGVVIVHSVPWGWER